jgi:hypothetical protein
MKRFSSNRTQEIIPEQFIKGEKDTCNKIIEINKYCSLITLSMNGLSPTIERHREQIGLENRIHLSLATKKHTSPSKADSNLG